MKTLPNGLTIFNATPHVIRFWREDWAEPVEVESDEIISAKGAERVIDHLEISETEMVEFVKTEFVPEEGVFHLIEEAYEMGADLVIGSMIAAQAYRGVVAMTPAPGYERVAPAEKRMNPDKFTTFF